MKCEKVYISPDLTSKQRKKDMELRKEIKRRNEAGEANIYTYIYIYRGEIFERKPNERDSGRVKVGSPAGSKRLGQAKKYMAKIAV